MEFKEGIFYDIPSAAYHAMAAASRSVLETVGTQSVEQAVHNEGEDVWSDAFEFGTSFHLRILEPEVYHREVVVLEGKQRANIGNVNWHKANPWVPNVLEKEVEMLVGMEQSLLNHAAASKLICDERGKAEVSVFWVDEDTGVRCKARPDWVVPGSYIADLKTTVSASPKGFQKSISNYRYDLQPAWYMKGWNQVCAPEERVADWLWIAVEKTPPYSVAVYRASENHLAFGSYDLKRWLPKYKAWKEEGIITGYSDQVQDIELARWDFNELMAREDIHG